MWDTEGNSTRGGHGLAPGHTVEQCQIWLLARSVAPQPLLAADEGLERSWVELWLRAALVAWTQHPSSAPTFSLGAATQGRPLTTAKVL